MKDTKDTEKMLAMITITIFFVSLIPILILARYNHSCADDYAYGFFAHRAWLETGSIWEAVKGAGVSVAERYMHWQGTFSSIFFMSIQPAVFNEKLYFVTPFLMLSMLSFSTLALLKVLVMDYLRGTKWSVLIIGSLLLLTSIQLMLAPVEGIYWFNGSVHYVFMYSCLLFSISFYLNYLANGKKRNLVLSCMFAFIVGGGNYVTALALILSIVIVAGFLFVYKQRKFISTAFVFVSVLTGLLISGLAPGNAIRQNNFVKMSIIDTIFRSFRDAAFFIVKNTSILYYLLLIFLIPVVWKIVSESKQKLRLSLLVPIISFCLVASMFAPTEYTMGLDYVGRTGNVILLLIELLGVLNEIYLLGWIAQKHKENSLIASITKIPAKVLPAFFIGVTVLAGITVFTTYKEKVYVSVNAMQSLYFGDAKAYDAEIQARMQILDNGKQEKAELQPLQNHPYLLYFDDITDNKKDWRNKAMSKFYGKKSVVIKP